MKSVDRWFYIVMALLAIATAVAGFAPSLIHTTSRKGPVSSLMLLHGGIAFLWLVAFLAQVSLVAARHTSLHRRLGPFAMLLAPLVVVSGFLVSVALARRGFDLSGDLHAQHDAFAEIAFPLWDLVVFSFFVLTGFFYRRWPEVHKRFMLLATVGGLMPAPLAHLIGHYPVLNVPAPVILLPITLFLFASPVHDRIVHGRFYAASLWGATATFLLTNLVATVISPSKSWHDFVAWLIR